jgi:hypothetical protein
MAAIEGWLKAMESGTSNCVEARWVRAGSCAVSGCVEARGGGGAVQVRDSKDPSGPTLSLSPTAWRGLLDAARRGTLDHLHQ